MNNINFGEAWVEALNGSKISRSGWNGKNLYVTTKLVYINQDESTELAVIVYPNGKNYPWVPSPTDLFAEDWGVL